ncbi:MAG: hypothetical protein IJ785_04265 [Bacteroidales bacterium]|nr:hypothetical protein [Bacteroidales bacterium]
MEYAIINFGVDDCRLNDIVKSINVGCEETFWTELLFRQRFEYNPLGKAVLACAFDAERVIACVVVERFPFQSVGRSMVGGILRVLFVQDGYNNKGLWTGILKVVEEECSCQNIDAIYCFNNNEDSMFSLTEDNGWLSYKGEVSYLLNSVTDQWRNIFKLMDINQPFIADVKENQGEAVDVDEPQEIGETRIADYYKWLFHTSCKRFVMVDNENVCAVVAIGQRGKRVKEARICYFEAKKGLEEAQQSLREIIHNKVDGIDVVSCIDSMNWLSPRNALKITQKVDWSYKCIRRPMGSEVSEIDYLMSLLQWLD